MFPDRESQAPHWGFETFSGAEGAHRGGLGVGGEIVSSQFPGPLPMMLFVGHIGLENNLSANQPKATWQMI